MDILLVYTCSVDRRHDFLLRWIGAQSGAHLHGLPMTVVNQDSGAEIGGHHVNEGETVVIPRTFRPTPVSPTSPSCRRVSWYDHKGLYRRSPELITFVSRVADERAASSQPALAGEPTTSDALLRRRDTSADTASFGQWSCGAPERGERQPAGREDRGARGDRGRPT